MAASAIAIKVSAVFAIMHADIKGERRCGKHSQALEAPSGDLGDRQAASLAGVCTLHMLRNRNVSQHAKLYISFCCISTARLRLQMTLKQYMIS